MEARGHVLPAQEDATPTPPSAWRRLKQVSWPTCATGTRKLLHFTESDGIVKRARDFKPLFEYYFENLSMIPDEKQYIVIAEGDRPDRGPRRGLRLRVRADRREVRRGGEVLEDTRDLREQGLRRPGGGPDRARSRAGWGTRYPSRSRWRSRSGSIRREYAEAWAAEDEGRGRHRLAPREVPRGRRRGTRVPERGEGAGLPRPRQSPRTSSSR